MGTRVNVVLLVVSIVTIGMVMVDHDPGKPGAPIDESSSEPACRSGNTIPREASDNETAQNGTPAPTKRRIRREGNPQCNMVWHYASPDVWTAPRNGYEQQGCAPRQSLTCTGRRSKALVIYMLHTRGSAYDMQPEMWNFEYFSRFGVFGPDQSTEMFDRVDYVFTRMVPLGLPRIASPTLCRQEENIQLLWVPDGPCDLCAHARVIEYLGGAATVARRYSYIVYMNAAARGPFQHRDDPAWIDVMAMAGQSHWDGASTPVAAGPTLSKDHLHRPPVDVHIQSYMVGMPTGLLPTIFPYLNRCEGDKNGCILRGEVAIGTKLMHSSAWLHTLSRNITVRDYNDVNAYGGMHRAHFPHTGDPMMTPFDVCASMFAKHGGTFLTRVTQEIAAQVAQLTLHQSHERVLEGHIILKRMLNWCSFVRL